MKIREIDIWIEENLIDLIVNKQKPLILWNYLYIIYSFFFYSLPQFYKRMICRFKGCDIIGGYGGWNLPPEAYCEWCNRCRATESNYEPETKHKLIYKDERFWRK